jgi:hypothetical protein
MCCERFLIYPRCAHARSCIGFIYYCPSYGSRGRPCVNNSGLPYKDYVFIIEDRRTQLFLDGREFSVSGGWKAEIALGYKGYCHNCLEGRTEPKTDREREEFLDDYLGEYDRWVRENDRRRKLVMEQERMMHRFKGDKGESGASGPWTVETD